MSRKRTGIVKNRITVHYNYFRDYKPVFGRYVEAVPIGFTGGAVFNKNGEVIGVATLLVKEAQNLNFAMPVNLLKEKITLKKLLL